MELFEVWWLHALLKCYIYNIPMARGASTSVVGMSNPCQCIVMGS